MIQAVKYLTLVVWSMTTITLSWEADLGEAYLLFDSVKKDTRYWSLKKGNGIRMKIFPKQTGI